MMAARTGDDRQIFVEDVSVTAAAWATWTAPVETRAVQFQAIGANINVAHEEDGDTYTVHELGTLAMNGMPLNRTQFFFRCAEGTGTMQIMYVTGVIA